MRARERLCHRQQKRRESRQRAGLCGLLTNCCLTPPSLSSPLYSAPDAKNEMKQKKKPLTTKKKVHPALCLTVLHLTKGDYSFPLPEVR